LFSAPVRRRLVFSPCVAIAMPMPPSPGRNGWGSGLDLLARLIRVLVSLFDIHPHR
jgi:hypothetical protein